MWEDFLRVFIMRKPWNIFWHFFFAFDHLQLCWVGSCAQLWWVHTLSMCIKKNLRSCGLPSAILHCQAYLLTKCMNRKMQKWRGKEASLAYHKIQQFCNVGWDVVLSWSNTSQNLRALVWAMKATECCFFTMKENLIPE